MGLKRKDEFRQDAVRIALTSVCIQSIIATSRLIYRLEF